MGADAAADADATTRPCREHSSTSTTTICDDATTNTNDWSWHDATRNDAPSTNATRNDADANVRNANVISNATIQQSSQAACAAASRQRRSSSTTTSATFKSRAQTRRRDIVVMCTIICCEPKRKSLQYTRCKSSKLVVQTK